MEKQEILSAYQFRHACKEFDSNKIIPKDDFEFILETARLSPSSFGFEPWSFVVLQDKALRAKLKPTSWGAQKQLDTASHFVLGLTLRPSFLKWNSEHIRQFMIDVLKLPDEAVKMRCKFFEDFQKTDFELTDDRKLQDWGSKQCYIPLANMMTAAALIGIDSCPIEGFKQKETEAILKNDIGIDMDKYSLSYMVAFGYRIAGPQFPKVRNSIDKIVHWK